MFIRSLQLTLCFLLVLLPSGIFAQGILDDSVLSVSIDGSTRVVMTDPVGGQVGARALEVFDAPAGGELDLRADLQYIAYPDPAVGEYNLSFLGTYDEVFAVTVEYTDQTTGQYERLIFDRWGTGGVPADMVLTISETASGTVGLTSPQLVQTSVRTTPVDSQTLVSWATVLDAMSYTLYSKLADYPRYTAQVVVGTSTVVEIPYATNSGDDQFPNDLYQFVVDATWADGTRTALSQPVRNDDRDGDRIRDWHETSIYDTNPDQADTDDDGLNDFFEVNRYQTDPNDPDTDSDGYVDGEEVAAGTDPRDAASYPGQLDCSVDNDGNLIVTDDCTITNDTEVSGNVMVEAGGTLRLQDAAQLLIDLSTQYIRIVAGGVLEIVTGSGISRQ